MPRPHAPIPDQDDSQYDTKDYTMTGAELPAIRESLGWIRVTLAENLGSLEGYTSQCETSYRPISPRLARQLCVLVLAYQLCTALGFRIVTIPVAGTPVPSPGRGYKASIPKQKTGNRRDYLVRRIARDRPDILARIKAGEFASVWEAARVASIVRDTRTALKGDAGLVDQILELWKRATPEELIRQRLRGQAENDWP